MSSVAGTPASGATHVFTIRPGKTTDSTRAYTTRKPHRKSKNGCAACKSKRVKCDESKPQCSRCVRAKSECVYDAVDGSGAGGDDGGRVSGSSSMAVPRLPNTLSKTPPELCLMKHYDVVTSQEFDTITFSNIIAGDRSPQYRALVLDQAKQHPHLMHSMLAVSALHLNQFGNKDYRRPGWAHLQVALPKFRESVAGPISPQESPHILYSAMLITLHYFCIDSRAVTDSWVFSSAPDRLDWLAVNRGLAPLFNATKSYHQDSFMTPVFKLVEDDEAVQSALPLSMFELCGYTATATQDDLRQNPYVPPLQQLNALMPLDRNLPTVLKYLRFMAAFDKRFFALINRNDPRALLIMSYGFALMCNVELWWTQPRARRDCWAICSYLDTLGDRNIRPHLGFPKRACGYESTFGPSAGFGLELVPVSKGGNHLDPAAVLVYGEMLTSNGGDHLDPSTLLGYEGVPTSNGGNYLDASALLGYEEEPTSIGAGHGVPAALLGYEQVPPTSGGI